MRHSRLAAAAAVIGVAGFTAAATAGDHKRGFETDMVGYEEVPAVSPPGGGQVEAEISRDGSEIRYVLRYSHLEAAPTQAHIHFGDADTTGGISVWLCDSDLNPSPRPTTPACTAPPATITGTLTPADVVGPTVQGIAPGEFEELVRAMRAGVTYANVHSTKFPTGEIRGQFDREGHQDN